MGNIDNTILNLGLAAADLESGDIVKIDTSGTIAKVASVEATDAVGIVTQDTSAGDAVPVLVRGIIDANVLIEDTDSASGYDKAVVAGDLAIISGKAITGCSVGQALSSIPCTAQTLSGSDGMIVGKFLEANAGSTAADTVTTLKVYVNFM